MVADQRSADETNPWSDLHVNREREFPVTFWASGQTLAVAVNLYVLGLENGPAGALNTL